MTNSNAEKSKNPNYTHLFNKYGVMATTENTPYKLCVIRDYDKSLDKVWHVEYYIWDEVNQKLVRRRVTLSDDTAKKRYEFAKQVIADIDQLLKGGAVTNPVEKKREINASVKSINNNSSLQDTCSYFLQFHKSTLKIRTFETYATDVKRFVIFLKRHGLDTMPLGKFDEQIAIQFLDELIVVDKISNRSRNNTKGTISTLFNFFRKRKIITENPFLNIKNLSHLSTKHTAFSKVQTAAFKKECIYRGEHQLLLFVSFIHYCFLRPRFELRLLKVGDIKEKTILVKAENAKDNVSEHVMIPEVLQKIIDTAEIRKYPEHFYVFGIDGAPGEIAVGRDHFYNRHRKILERLKLTGQNLDTYSWKHTGVIALFQVTQNIELVRQQCRHSDIATTQKYLRDLGQFVDYEQINKFPEF